MKTYSNKSNAVRAMNTYTQKVQQYLKGAEVVEHDNAFAVSFSMDSGTPAEMIAMLGEKFIVSTVKPEPVVGEVVRLKKENVTGKGLKIQKDREERNGIKRPSAGGKCAAVWELCEEIYAEKGMVPTPSVLKGKAEERGLNPNNVSIELYRWRAWMGFKGRK